MSRSSVTHHALASAIKPECLADAIEATKPRVSTRRAAPLMLAPLYALAAHVARERHAGIKRDRIIARIMRDRIIPVTSRAVSYVTRDTLATYASSARESLMMRARRETFRKRVLRKRAGWSNVKPDVYASRARVTRSMFGAHAREYVRNARDLAARATITRDEQTELARELARQERQAERLARYQLAQNVSRRPRLYGIVDGLEPRVAPRGANGNPSVKIGLASHVTQRDHHAPAAMLNHLATVGVATHPDASSDQSFAALAYCREHPTAGTVRVITRENPAGVIRPVTDFTGVKSERMRVKRESAQDTMRAERERIKLATLVRVGGYATELASGSA